MNDTPSEVQRRYDDMFMAMTPAERLHIAGRMFSAARRLVTAGILHEQWDIDPVELRRRIFCRFYGSDFSAEEIARIFEAIPSLRGAS